MAASVVNADQRRNTPKKNKNQLRPQHGEDEDEQVREKMQASPLKPLSPPTQTHKQEQSAPAPALAVNDIAHLKLAKKLADNEKTVRDKAVTLLQQWLLTRPLITPMEMRKVNKGIFYCMWMSDKVGVQQELAVSLAKLQLPLAESRQQMFVAAFFDIMLLEWNGIDRLRHDKFYTLMRRILFYSFQYLHMNRWKQSLVDEYVNMLQSGPLSPDTNAPGILLHLADIFLAELTGLNARVPASALLSLMQPWVLVSMQCEKHVAKRVSERVWQRLVADIASEQEKDPLGVRAIAPMLSKQLFQLASARETPERARKPLYSIRRLFLAIPGLGIELEESELQKQKDEEEQRKNAMVEEEEREEEDDDMDVVGAKKEKNLSKGQKRRQKLNSKQRAEAAVPENGAADSNGVEQDDAEDDQEEEEENNGEQLVEQTKKVKGKDSKNTQPPLAAQQHNGIPNGKPEPSGNKNKKKRKTPTSTPAAPIATIVTTPTKSSSKKSVSSSASSAVPAPSSDTSDSGVNTLNTPGSTPGPVKSQSKLAAAAAAAATNSPHNHKKQKTKLDSSPTPVPVPTSDSILPTRLSDWGVGADDWGDSGDALPLPPVVQTLFPGRKGGIIFDHTGLDHDDDDDEDDQPTPRTPTTGKKGHKKNALSSSKKNVWFSLEANKVQEFGLSEAITPSKTARSLASNAKSPNKTNLKVKEPAPGTVLFTAGGKQPQQLATNTTSSTPTPKKKGKGGGAAAENGRTPNGKVETAVLTPAAPLDPQLNIIGVTTSSGPPSPKSPKRPITPKHKKHPVTAADFF